MELFGKWANILKIKESVQENPLRELEGASNDLEEMSEVSEQDREQANEAGTEHEWQKVARGRPSIRHSEQTPQERVPEKSQSYRSSKASKSNTTGDGVMEHTMKKPWTGRKFPNEGSDNPRSSSLGDVSSNTRYKVKSGDNLPNQKC